VQPTARLSERRRTELAQAARVINAAAQAGRPAAEPAPAARADRGDITWSVRARADQDGASGELCGGKVCKADQFCCGPPECGTCANRMSGPRCPNSCP
jgi:hypothetical protein